MRLISFKYCHLHKEVSKYRTLKTVPIISVAGWPSTAEATRRVMASQRRDPGSVPGYFM
jgi:hypothetical protein